MTRDALARQTDAVVDGSVQPAADPKPEPLGHLPVLDEIRGIAILLVIVFHSSHFTLDPLTPSAPAIYLYYQRLTQCGWIGVDLFFVLSGFLITRILLGAKDGPRYFRNFYARRFLRIFPLYYVTLAIFAAAVAVKAVDGSGALPWLATYTSNLLSLRPGSLIVPASVQHFWSLAVEEQFYLVWPLVVLFASSRALVRICATVIVCAAAVRASFVLSGNVDAPYFFTLCRSDALATGAGIAVLLGRSRAPSAELLAWAKRLLAASGLALAALASARGGTLSFQDPWVLALGLSLLSLTFGSCLVIALATRRGARPARISGGLTAFGKYSYAMYVFHQPIFIAIGRMRQKWYPGGTPHVQILIQLLALAGGLAATFVLALASWHVLEKRMVALKRYFA